MDQLCNQISILFLFIRSVQLDELYDAIDKSVLDHLCHLILDRGEAKLPECGAFRSEKICSLEDQEHISESLHLHAERDPEVPEEAQEIYCLGDAL